MKVAELEGADLDYWVALADGKVAEIVPQRVWGDGYGITFVDGKPACRVGLDYFDPSTNWAQGGPIIEKHVIATWCGSGKWFATPMGAVGYDGCDYIDVNDWGSLTGPTPLIAAMRCLVASKYGEEVPDVIEK